MVEVTSVGIFWFRMVDVAGIGATGKGLNSRVSNRQTNIVQ